MPRLSPELIRALRALEPRRRPADVDKLAASIDAAAAPALAARRQAGPGWWELPAAWAATLIPISLVLAAASIVVLWRVEPPRPDVIVAQATVDETVNELVPSSPAPARTPRR